MLRQRPLQLINPFAGDGGDGVKLELPALDVSRQLLQLVRVRAVDLGGADNHGFPGQRVAGLGRLAGVIREGVGFALGRAAGEAGQLLVDDLEVFHRIGTAAGVGNIDQVKQQAGALNVAQKLHAEALAEMRAFNEAGHVGDDEGLHLRLLTHGDHAEIGLERGEGVVGDLGPRGGDARDECGLAGVGIANQAHVGQQLEFEAIEALLAGVAQFVLAGSLVDGGGEVLVAASAASALGDDDLLVGLGKVVNQLAGFLVVKAGAYGNLQNDRFGVLAGAVRAHAVFAVPRLVFRIVAEVNQRIVALRRDHDDVAAMAAVAARGTAARNEFLAPEGHAAIAAVTGLDANFCLINKHS